MQYETLNIWGREIKIQVAFDCYEGEEVLVEQKEALAAFMHTSMEDLCNGEKVLAWLKENYPEEVKDDNVFSYLHPESLYIVRNKNKHEVAITCDFKFDLEHGLAVVYADEKIDRIISPDELY